MKIWNFLMTTVSEKFWHSGEEEWYLSVVDVVQVLTDSSDPKQYIKKMRARDKALKSKWGTICTPLQMLAPDGKMRKHRLPTQKEFLESFSQFLHQKLSHLKHCWQKLVQKDWKKLLIRRKQWNVRLLHIKQKGIQMNGKMQV